jgi:hypothetical protein
MSEMIERVTKAIEAAKMEWSSEDASADQWTAPADYLASAAVKAMREPTTAMTEAEIFRLRQLSTFLILERWHEHRERALLWFSPIDQIYRCVACGPLFGYPPDEIFRPEYLDFYITEFAGRWSVSCENVMVEMFDENPALAQRRKGNE